MENPEIFATAEALEKKLKKVVVRNNKYYNYYYQNLVVPDFGVSTPPKMRYARQLLGWPTLAVDTIVDRLNFRGFYSSRKEDQPYIDALMRVYRENYFDTEQKSAQVDASITGAAYISVGSGDVENDEPEILWRSENPNSVYGFYDQRSHNLKSVLKFVNYGDYVTGTLTTRTEIYSLIRQKNSKEWLVEDIQENVLGYVPYFLITNNSDGMNPLGRSDITPSLISLTDNGMRTLLSAEVIREYFTQPIRAIAGLNPAEFFTADGREKNIYDMIAGGILNLPYNSVIKEMPQFQELTASSPKVVMEQLEGLSSLAAREIGVPPSETGMSTVNPASVEAINAADKKIHLKVKRRMPVQTRAMKKVAKATLDLLGMTGYDLAFIECLWERPETPTPAAQADRISKMNAMGIFDSPKPDFVYRDLDMTQIDILELKQHLREVEGNSMINQLLMGGNEAVNGNEPTAG